jgi:transposase
MSEHTLYVGLDTDKRGIDVAVADPLPGGEVRYWGRTVNDPVSLDHLMKRLTKGGRGLEVCYEAGPCGYAIHRQLAGKAGVRCRVVAPSMTPRRPGSRVKTNRRDALMLARLLRAEELTAVWVPDATHEAMRDLVRLRGSATEDLRRCRQRISGFLLRQRIDYAGKPWTKKHRTWLGQLEFEHQAHRLMFTVMLQTLDQAQAQHDQLVDHIAETVAGWSLYWLVEALQVLRGFRLINAVTMATEIGDPRRFAHPRQLMAYVGMVPSEHSTGDRVCRGGLTKAGNRRVRTAVIEAAWTYTRPIKSPAARCHDAALVAIADKARHRLSRRYRQLQARGKKAPVAATAVARELLGFVWAIAHAAGAQQQPR